MVGCPVGAGCDGGRVVGVMEVVGVVVVQVVGVMVVQVVVTGMKVRVRV